jgi:hypothetical protein
MIWVVIAIAAALWLVFVARDLRAYRSRKRLREAANEARIANQGQFNTVVWERLTATQRVTDVLLCERRLGAIEAHLQASAQLLENLENVSENLTQWRQAAATWLEQVMTVVPDVGAAIVPPDRAALRRARTLLPATANLSSQDLKAATSFIVEREQMDAAQRRFVAHRDRLIDQYRGARAIR